MLGHQPDSRDRYRDWVTISARPSIEAMPIDTGRCSVASAQREEPLAGTAPTARRWVLIEHSGPWARQPLDTPPLGGQFATRLEATMRDHGARLLLIRRPGRQPNESEPRLWRVVDVVTGHAISGLWQTDRDLEAVIPAIPAVSGPLADPAQPMLLVCTHGVRDACCAIKGRPIVGMLARVHGDEVWECSHLNGHRFAGTALSLPDGACFGRLDQADAVRVIADHRAGRVDAHKLRGLSGLEPAEQAAHVWALAQLAAKHPDAPRSVDDVEIRSASEERDGHRLIELAGADDSSTSVWVDVQRTELAPHPLSCGKPGEAATSHTVLGVATPTPGVTTPSPPTA